MRSIEIMSRVRCRRVAQSRFSRSFFGGFIFLATYAILFQKAASADSPAPPQRVFTAQYTPIPDLQVPLIEVRLDKKVNCTFLIDTGTNNNLLTDALVQQLGLTPKPTIKNGKPYLFYGEPSQCAIATSCEVGTLTIATPLYIIIKQKLLYSTTRQDLTGQPVDGILSSAVLSMFSVLFDSPKHQMTLWYPGSLSDTDIRAAGFDPSQAVPLTAPPDDFLYYLTAHFQNGKEKGDEKLLMDTGSSDTMISATLAQRLKLKPDSAEKSVKLLSGSFNIKRARVSRLTIGGVTASDVEVEYPSNPKDQKPTVLGMNFLSQYRFLIDFGSHRLFLANGQASTTGAMPQITSPAPNLPSNP